MKLTESIFDGLVVIEIGGDLDHANIGMLNDLIAAHLNSGRYRLVLDLADCPYIDSAGIGAILTLVRTIEGKGTVAVAAPSGNVRRLLHLVGLPEEDCFEIFDDLTAARSAVTCRV